MKCIHNPKDNNERDETQQASFFDSPLTTQQKQVIFTSPKKDKTLEYVAKIS